MKYKIIIRDIEKIVINITINIKGFNGGGAVFDKLLIFLMEIKKKDNWKDRWVKKLTYDRNKSVLEIYERKFAKNEIKEICRNAKKKVTSIKEYRYDNEGFLKKVVIKDGEGTIKYINDIQYDDRCNIKSVLSVSKNDDIEFSKLSIVGKNDRIVKEEFCFMSESNEVISKREITYGESGDIVYNIYGEKLKENCAFDMDNNVLIMTYYDECDSYIGDIVYGFKDILIFTLNNRSLKNSESTKELTIGFKELMSEEEFIEMSCKSETESELNDMILQCFYRDKGQIQNVNFLKQGQVLYSNEYIYE